VRGSPQLFQTSLSTGSMHMQCQYHAYNVSHAVCFFSHAAEQHDSSTEMIKYYDQVLRTMVLSKSAAIMLSSLYLCSQYVSHYWA